MLIVILLMLVVTEASICFKGLCHDNANVENHKT